MPAGSHRFQLGTTWCTVLSDGYSSYPTRWFFPDADLEKLSHALETHRLPQENILSPYTCLLIETGRHTVLVDTGLGAASNTSGAIVARLEVEGIRPQHIDTVVITHAHPDHIGGSVNSRRPMFPNARYVISEAEWDFWMSPHPDLNGLRVPAEQKTAMDATARRCLQAVRHQVEMIGRETEIVPGLWLIPAPGHTPGHLALVLSSGTRQLMNLGDAAVHPLHLEHPEWENGFDLAPDRAIATRRALLERAAAENMDVMAFHFPFPSVGRLAPRQGGGWNWEPAG